MIYEYRVAPFRRYIDAILYRLHEESTKDNDHPISSPIQQPVF